MSGPALVLRSSLAWVPERIGCLGASELVIAAEKTKNGKRSAAGERLIKCKVAEMLTNIKTGTPPTMAMQRGIDMQDPAVREYELVTGRFVLPEAMVRHPSIDGFLATPDGWIGNDGLLEVKVPQQETFVGWVSDGVIPEQHVMQMCGQIACSRRTWVDFCAYCPESREGRRLFVRRFVPTAEQIEQAEQVAIDFLKEVNELFERVIAQEMVA